MHLNPTNQIKSFRLPVAEQDFMIASLCPCTSVALPTIMPFLFHNLNAPWLFSHSLDTFLSFFSYSRIVTNPHFLSKGIYIDY